MDNEDEVTLRAFGKSVSIKGLGTIFVMVVLIFASGLAWMLYDLSHSAALAVEKALIVQQQIAIEHKAIIDSALAIKLNQEVILDGMRKIDSSVKTQNWILLADPVEKADIKQRMAMPKELRELGVRERQP